MIIGVPKETFPGEHRVALVPALIPNLTKAGLEVQVEAGCGQPATYGDGEYEEKGAKVVSRDELFAAADVLLQVRAFGANPEQGREDLDRLREGQIVIGFCEPLVEHDCTKELAERKVSLYSMELMPRITRAQSMDALSSMATIAGYKAVLLAAENLPRMFPMLMTAAGTIAPAHVFVIGAGVAGLQALATARRLGAVTSAYDVRPAVKDQVQSVGAKFIEMELETETAEGKGGYAKEMDEEFYRKQRELMTQVVADNHVVITTAAIPGKKSPLLVTAEMLKGMPAGSVIVDLAAERGGNCEVTQANERVEHEGVTVLGPTNLPATVPYHASQMYAKNIVTFLLHCVKEGEFPHEAEDEIVQETQCTHGGEVTNARVRELMGLEPLAKPEPEKPAEEEQKEEASADEEKPDEEQAEGELAAESAADESAASPEETKDEKQEESAAESEEDSDKPEEESADESDQADEDQDKDEEEKKPEDASSSDEEPAEDAEEPKASSDEEDDESKDSGS